MPGSTMVYRPGRGQQTRECVIIEPGAKMEASSWGMTWWEEQGGCCTPRWKQPPRLDTGTLPLWEFLFSFLMELTKCKFTESLSNLSYMVLSNPHLTKSLWLPILLQSHQVHISIPKGNFLKVPLWLWPQRSVSVKQNLGSMTDCLNHVRLCDTMFVLWGCAILFTQWMTNRFSLF